jgi:hypothetical protein
MPIDAFGSLGSLDSLDSFASLASEASGFDAVIVPERLKGKHYQIRHWCAWMCRGVHF